MTGPQKIITAVVRDEDEVHASFTVGVQTFGVGPFIDLDDVYSDCTPKFIQRMLDKAFAKIQLNTVEWTNEQWQRRSSGDKSAFQYSKRIIRCLEKS